MRPSSVSSLRSAAALRRLLAFEPLQQFAQGVDDLASLDFRLAKRKVEAVWQRFVLELKGEVLRTARFFRFALLAELLPRQIARCKTPQRLLHRLLGSGARDLHQDRLARHSRLTAHRADAI